METMANTEIARSVQALTAADRCDRCAAQAYVRVDLPSGNDLLFCAHHSKMHAPVLKPIAVNWHDETKKLME